MRWLPAGCRQALRRAYYAWQIRAGRFGSDEADFSLLSRLVGNGETVLDIGANVGRYTLRLSELVGRSGRVFAFEPVPETFEILAANARRARYENITLMNVAVSNASRVARLVVPTAQAGFAAHYFAHVDEKEQGGPGRSVGQVCGWDGEIERCQQGERETPDESKPLSLCCSSPLGDSRGLCAFCCSIDALGIAERISLAKIDVEGHERQVLEGMRETIDRDRPTLIVEGDDPAVAALLEEFGYRGRSIEGTRNRIFTPAGRWAMVEAACAAAG